MAIFKKVFKFSFLYFLNIERLALFCISCNCSSTLTQTLECFIIVRVVFELRGHRSQAKHSSKCRVVRPFPTWQCTCIQLLIQYPTNSLIGIFINGVFAIDHKEIFVILKELILRFRLVLHFIFLFGIQESFFRTIKKSLFFRFKLGLF